MCRDTTHLEEEQPTQLDMEPTLASGRRQRGLAATGVSASSATLRRVNVDNDACVSAIPTRLAKGNVARDEDDPDGVVLGRGLARSLDLAVGGELTVLSQADDGVIVNDLYAVPGILQNASDDRTAPRSVEHHGFRTELHASWRDYPCCPATDQPPHIGPARQQTARKSLRR